MNSPILTDAEACRWLRLDVDAPNESAGLRRLARLVDSGLLRPAIIGKRRRFLVSELERFAAAQVERYGEVRR